MSGAFAGLGGSYLAIVASNHYQENQVGGRGYIGLAALIFGNWRPGGLMSGAALFGFADALQLRDAEAVHAQYYSQHHLILLELWKSLGLKMAPVYVKLIEKF